MARVLIVEDDPATARLLELTLGAEGHDTETVDDGGLALARLEGPPVDLVVLDVMLPSVDGLTVLRALRDHPAWGEARVMLLTALDDDADVWRGWASGTDYYLTKPFELAQLRAVVERLLGDPDTPASDAPDAPDGAGEGVTDDPLAWLEASG